MNRQTQFRSGLNLAYRGTSVIISTTIASNGSVSIISAAGVCANSSLIFRLGLTVIRQPPYRKYTGYTCYSTQ
jgi:hypothetical protein